MTFTSMTEGGLIAFSDCGNYMCATRTDDEDRSFTQAWKLEKPQSRDLGTFGTFAEAHNACLIDQGEPP